MPIQISFQLDNIYSKHSRLFGDEYRSPLKHVVQNFNSILLWKDSFANDLSHIDWKALNWFQMMTIPTSIHFGYNAFCLKCSNFQIVCTQGIKGVTNQMYGDDAKKQCFKYK